MQSHDFPHPCLAARSKAFPASQSAMDRSEKPIKRENIFRLTPRLLRISRTLMVVLPGTTQLLCTLPTSILHGKVYTRSRGNASGSSCNFFVRNFWREFPRSSSRVPTDDRCGNQIVWKIAPPGLTSMKPLEAQQWEGEARGNTRSFRNAARGTGRPMSRTFRAASPPRRRLGPWNEGSA